jgi:hypothetical protein
VQVQGKPALVPAAALVLVLQVVGAQWQGWWRQGVVGEVLLLVG